MKKLIITLLIMLVASASFAKGNTEKLAEIEGTVVNVVLAQTRAEVTVRTNAGDVIVEFPAGEVERLRVRVQTRIHVEGILVGVPEAQKTQIRSRILAKIVDLGNGDLTVEDPLRLTLQDRVQIRTYEREQLKVQAQTRNNK